MRNKMRMLYKRIQFVRQLRKTHEEEVKKLAKQEKELLEEYLEVLREWVRS